MLSGVCPCGRMPAVSSISGHMMGSGSRLPLVGPVSPAGYRAQVSAMAWVKPWLSHAHRTSCAFRSYSVLFHVSWQWVVRRLTMEVSICFNVLVSIRGPLDIAVWSPQLLAMC